MGLTISRGLVSLLEPRYPKKPTKDWSRKKQREGNHYRTQQTIIIGSIAGQKFLKGAFQSIKNRESAGKLIKELLGDQVIALGNARVDGIKQNKHTGEWFGVYHRPKSNMNVKRISEGVWQVI